MRLYTANNRFETKTRSRLLGPRRRLADETIRLLDGEGELVRAVSYANLYTDNAWVYGSIRRLSRDAANLDWQVYTLDADGNREVVRGNLPTSRKGAPPAEVRLDNMFRRPGERRSKNSLIAGTITDMGIYGNALWVPDWAANTLTHIPWSQITVDLDSEDLSIIGYEVDPQLATALFGDEDATYYLPEDVVHFGKGDHPEEPLGLSPLKPLAKSTRLMDAMHRYLRAYFANQASPSGNLKLPKGATRADLEFVENQIKRERTGPDKAGGVMVTTGDWQSIRSEPSHTRVIKLDQLSREEVVAVLGVPLDRMQALPNPNDRFAYYRDILGPWVGEIEDEIEAQLLPMRDSLATGVMVRADLDTPVRGDIKTRMEGYRQGRFVYTLNDFRRKEGLKPIPDERADTIWLPANEVPLIEGVGPGYEPTGVSGSAPHRGEANPDAQPNEFGDGVAAEDQRPTGNRPNNRARLFRHAPGKHDQSTHGNWADGLATARASFDKGFLPDKDGNPGKTIQGLVRDATDPDDGFSVDPATGEWPSDGYMVGGEGPEKAIEPDSTVMDEARAVQDYVTQHATILKRGDVYLGGWRRPRDMALVVDASRRVDDLDEAMALARERDEDAIFDVANLDVIETIKEAA